MKTAVKTRRQRWLWPAAGGALLALTWALWQACGRFPAVSALFRKVAQLLSTGLGFLSGLLPVPASEVLIALLVVIVLVALIIRGLGNHAARQKEKKAAMQQV